MSIRWIIFKEKPEVCTAMKKLYFLSVFAFLSACILPYDKAFKAQRTVLIIDALLTDNPSLNKITLSRTEPSPAIDVYSFKETGAEIFLLIDTEEHIILTENKPGEYYFPQGFVAKKGLSYFLNITTADGSYFESDPQRLTPTSPIESVTQVYKTENEADFIGARDGHSIYLNSSDEPDQKNFYRWDWKLYEKATWCKTCNESIYYHDDTTPPEGECRASRGQFRNLVFDYSCDGECWRIIPSQNTNIMSDEFVDGRPIQNRHIADIPIYQYRGAILEIFQYSIDETVYDYFKLVQGVAENTGGLADTPPASLQGNVRCISNPDQPVAGMFIVAGVSKTNYWLDRSDAPTDFPAIGFLDGRFPNPEPTTPTRPPLAPCLESLGFTSTKPVGWQD